MLEDDGVGTVISGRDTLVDPLDRVLDGLLVLDLTSVVDREEELLVFVDRDTVEDVVVVGAIVTAEVVVVTVEVDPELGETAARTTAIEPIDAGVSEVVASI